MRKFNYLSVQGDDHIIEMTTPNTIDSWVFDAFSEMYQNLKSKTSIEESLPTPKSLRHYARKTASETWVYVKNNKGVVIFGIVLVGSSAIDAQMYWIPGEILAGANTLYQFLYPVGGVLPNFVLPIAFGKDTYVWAMEILRPTPGLEKIRTRKYGKKTVYTFLALASAFGLLSAAEFAAVQVTEGGLSGFNIFLTLMVLLGNAIMNGKAAVSLASYPSLLLPVAQSAFAKLTASCKTEKALLLSHRQAINAANAGEFLNLSKRVLENGVYRIEDFLLRNPNINTLNFEAISKAEYPYLNKSDFEFLKTLYKRIRSTDDIQYQNELDQLLRLIMNISSDRQYREYPDVIRILIGWPGALLGNVSTAGYYALILMLLTAKMGDAAGYSLAVISSLAFFYLVGIVSLDSFEIYAKGIYDITRISAEKVHSKLTSTAPSTVSNYGELLPTALRNYPLLTLALAAPLVGTAAYSFPTSVASTLTYVPQVLVKWFGGQPADYLAFAASLTWPTIIGAFAFNGNPMFGVAQGMALFFMSVLHGITPRVDTHKISTTAVKDELSNTVSHLFKADSENTLAVIRAAAAIEKENHDVAPAEANGANNNNDAPRDPREENSPHPFRLYSENYNENKRTRKYGCSSTALSWMTSLFIGRKIAGDDYQANLEGQSVSETRSLI
jgi:hypothetical protein